MAWWITGFASGFVAMYGLVLWRVLPEFFRLRAFRAAVEELLSGEDATLTMANWSRGQGPVCSVFACGSHHWHVKPTLDAALADAVAERRRVEKEQRK